MEKVNDDVDEFIRSAARSAELARLDEVIGTALPGLDRTLWRGKMWGGTDQAIIGYGAIIQPRPRGKGAEWFLVGLAEQKNYLSVYVNAAEDGAYLVQQWGSRLGKVKLGSAAVSFNSVNDLDLEALAELIRRAHELSPQAT